MAKTPKQRPLTPDDLKSLVQSLGALVRESVREEVRDQLKPIVDQVALMKGELTALKRLDESVNRTEGVIRDVPAMVTKALDENRQRVIADMKRDYEHRVYLGEIDAARHPERFGASSKEIAEARAANLAAAIAYEAKRGNFPDEPPLPKLVDGEVVPKP